MKKWTRWVGWAALAALIAYSAVSEPRGGLPPKEERLYGVSQIWKQASDFYALWDLTDEDLDWDQAYETAFKEAASAKNARDYYLTLKKFLANLHDGHADGLYAPEFEASKSWLPFGMKYMDQKYVIVSSSDEKKCPLGAVVETVDGMQAGEYLEKTWGGYVGLQTPGAREDRLSFFLLNAGRRGDKIRLGLALEDGRKAETQVSWNERPKNYRQAEYKTYGNLLYTSDAFDVTMTEDNLAWVEFKTQASVTYADQYFNQVVPFIAGSKGVILDVRENGGGNSMVGQAVLESFIGNSISYKGTSLDTIKISSNMANYRFWSNNINPDDKVYNAYKDQLDFAVESGREMYCGRFLLTGEQMEKISPTIWEGKEFTGKEFSSLYEDRIPGNPMIGKPMVLLVGYGSGSATDTMAAMARDEGFTLVGTRTRGATGNVIGIPAGGGWRAGISTQYSVTSEGIPINNHGVEATVYVEQSLEDFRNKTDTQLEKAMEILR